MKKKQIYQEEEDVLSNGTPVINLYDLTGYLVTQKEYSDVMERKYSYDSQGRDIMTEIVYEPLGWMEYTYNSAGFLISETQYIPEYEDGYETRYTYNKKGMLTSKTKFDRQHRIIKETVRTSDLAQAALTLRRKSKQGIPGIGILEVYEGNQKQVYNKYGDLCSRVVFGRTGKIIGRTVYNYRNDGKLILKKVWDENQKCLHIFYDYDKEGRLKAKRILNGQKVLSKIDFSYSDRGGLLSRVADSYQMGKRGQVRDDTLHTVAYKDYDYQTGELLIVAEQKDQTDQGGNRILYEHNVLFKKNPGQEHA